MWLEMEFISLCVYVKFNVVENVRPGDVYLMVS